VADLGSLARFKEEAQPPTPRRPKEVYRFVGTVLVFDQTISKTGWAFGVSREDRFEVRATGVFLTDMLASGHEDNLRRAVRCYRQYKALLQSFVPDMIVHEMPPISNAYVRGDSSLVAAVAVRLAHDETFSSIPIRMVSAQHAKKVLTGNAKASKAEVKFEVLKLADCLAQMKPLNQDVTDAVALALVAINEAP
jgi:Holliday junction resolvasome RuvABC endonuclease subunit